MDKTDTLYIIYSGPMPMFSLLVTSLLALPLGAGFLLFLYSSAIYSQLFPKNLKKEFDKTTQEREEELID